MRRPTSLAMVAKARMSTPNSSRRGVRACTARRPSWMARAASTSASSGRVAARPIQASSAENTASVSPLTRAMPPSTEARVSAMPTRESPNSTTPSGWPAMSSGVRKSKTPGPTAWPGAGLGGADAIGSVPAAAISRPAVSRTRR